MVTEGSHHHSDVRGDRLEGLLVGLHLCDEQTTQVATGLMPLHLTEQTADLTGCAGRCVLPSTQVATAVSEQSLGPGLPLLVGRHVFHVRRSDAIERRLQCCDEVIQRGLVGQVDRGERFHLFLLVASQSSPYRSRGWLMYRLVLVRVGDRLVGVVEVRSVVDDDVNLRTLLVRADVHERRRQTSI